MYILMDCVWIHPIHQNLCNGHNGNVKIIEIAGFFNVV